MSSDTPTQPSRRRFLKSATASLASPLLIGSSAYAAAKQDEGSIKERLLAAQTSPVLRRDRLPEPVVIDSIELLRKGPQFYVRVRSKAGVTGIAMTNKQQIRYVYPIFLQKVAPYFEGKDARDLDQLVEGVFAHEMNYKWQSLPFWVCVSWMEFALLDLLGRTTGLSAGKLLGDPVRKSSKIYYANGDRKSPPEKVVDQLEALIAKSGARAVKHKLGMRMRYSEQSNARDRAMIPLARKRLGDATTIFCDANSSFDVKTALEMGKLLEEHNYGFFEEPVRFDDFEGTKAVADALSIPVAGGEQEVSMLRFKQQIEHGIVQVAQPDILFFGGFVRSIRVARMAEVKGLKVVPHMSGFGLGILHVLHFASVVPNSLDYQEYKGDKDGIPYEVIGTGKPLQTVDGEIAIPDGPGLGVDFPPDYLKQLKLVTV